MVGRPVARQVHHHDVVVRVDRRADFVERFAQVGHGRERRRQQRLRIVDEHDRAAARAPALVHDVLRGLDVPAEHVLRPIRCKADEIEIGHAGTLILELAQQLIEQERLRGEDRLGACVEAARGFTWRRIDEPGIVGCERGAEPDRDGEQRPSRQRGHHAAPSGRVHGQRDAADENDDHPDQHDVGGDAAIARRQAERLEQQRQFQRHLHGRQRCQHDDRQG